MAESKLKCVDYHERLFPEIIPTGCKSNEQRWILNFFFVVVWRNWVDSKLYDEFIITSSTQKTTKKSLNMYKENFVLI